MIKLIAFDLECSDFVKYTEQMIQNDQLVSEIRDCICSDFIERYKNNLPL